MNLDALNLNALNALRPILPIPLWQKAAVLAGSCIALLAAYLYMGWYPLQDDIGKQQVAVEQQRVILKRNQRLAKDLPKKQAEYNKLESQLKVALNMLPKKAQIPDLLVSVSRAGKESGLDFSEFKPMGEAVKQIYAEVPVTLDISGTFRQLMTFLNRVGELPRIVDIKDLTLSQSQAGGGLTIKGKAVTYRFIEQSEVKKGRARARAKK